MTPEEYAELRDAEVDGLFELHSWYQAAVIAATIHNQMERMISCWAKDYRAKMLKPENFLPSGMEMFGESPAQQGDPIESFVREMNAATYGS